MPHFSHPQNQPTTQDDPPARPRRPLEEQTLRHNRDNLTPFFAAAITGVLSGALSNTKLTEPGGRLNPQGIVDSAFDVAMHAERRMRQWLEGL